MKSHYINFIYFTKKIKLSFSIVANMYRKVILSKQGDEPTKVRYEIGEEIEKSEYEGLFNNFTPNFEFSLVDRFIQEFSSDIVPSFKRSSAFTKEDLENIVRSFKNDYKIKKKANRKKPTTYFRPKSRRVPPTNKQNKQNKQNGNNNNQRKTKKNKNTSKKKINNKK